MLVELNDLKKVLFEAKEKLIFLLDTAHKNKVRFLIETRISVIDNMFLWINQIEQKGDGTMEALKLGKLTTWEPKPRQGSIDEKIIEDSKNLKRNYDAIKVTVETVKWTTFCNRTYKLREEGKINDHIVPRKDGDGIPHLVYLDEPNPRRALNGKKK